MTNSFFLTISFCKHSEPAGTMWVSATRPEGVEAVSEADLDLYLGEQSGFGDSPSKVLKIDADRLLAAIAACGEFGQDLREVIARAGEYVGAIGNPDDIEAWVAEMKEEEDL